MSEKTMQIRNSTVDFLVFTKQNSQDSIEVRVQDENVWLTQNGISRLFDKGRSTITEHLNAIFAEGELDESSVCRKFRQTEFLSKSPSLKMLDRCSAIVDRPLSKRIAIASCVHQFVSSAYITSTPFSLPSAMKIRNSAVLISYFKFLCHFLRIFSSLIFLQHLII